jgi:1-acyl-sn-glycerol-3-phosphate acyltransferase
MQQRSADSDSTGVWHKKRRKREPIYALAQSIVIPWLHLWFRWHIEGLHHIPREGPAIVASNHIAYLDPLVLSYIIIKAGRRPRFLAKAELFADKRIGWVLRGARQIEVKRGTRDAPIALDAALRALEEGEIVVIFPEGTVTTDPDLNPMPAKTGAMRLALASKAPLIPVGVWGTANVWPKGYAHRWRPRQQILVRIGEPIDLLGDAESPAAWRAAGARLMEEIGKLVAGLRPVVPDRRRPRKKRPAA